MKKLSIIFIGFCLLLTGCEMNAELWDSVDSPDSVQTRSLPDGIISVSPSDRQTNVDATMPIQVEFNMDVPGFNSSSTALVLNNCKVLPCSSIPGTVTYSSAGLGSQAVFNLPILCPFLDRNTTYQLVLSSPAPSYTWEFTTKDYPKVDGRPTVRRRLHGSNEIEFQFNITESVKTGSIELKIIEKYASGTQNTRTIIADSSMPSSDNFTLPNVSSCPSSYPLTPGITSLEVILQNVKSSEPDAAPLGGISRYSYQISEIQ